MSLRDSSHVRSSPGEARSEENSKPCAEPRAIEVQDEFTPGAPVSEIDWNIAKNRLGDATIAVLCEFNDLLKIQIPKLFADIRLAIDTRNGQLLRRCAHTLRGSVSYVGAKSLAEVATILENLGHAESFEQAIEILPKLKGEVDRVMSALEVGPSGTTM